jgi:Kdo2-lipid IVA lauroyltransferase/acyltransferase
MAVPFKWLAWFYYLLPTGFKLLIIRLVSEILQICKVRSDVIEANLKLAFPQTEKSNLNRLKKSAYQHLSFLFFEVFYLFGPMTEFVKKYSVLEGVENWKKAHEKGKGIIFISSHVGNWEVMAVTGAMLGGFDLMLVTKQLKPSWFHNIIEHSRRKCGVKATYEPKTLRDVLKHLQSNGTVGLVVDQYSGPPVGVRVPVFKTPVGTSTVVATLAKRTGAVVLPVVNYRVVTPQGIKWRVEIRPALDWLDDPNPEYETAVNTARYSAEIEKDIYSHPEQWLWSHKRFKGDLSPLKENEWREGRMRC